MSTMIPKTTRMLTNLGLGLTTWLVRLSSRNELSSLTDRDLRDIGVSLCDARRETAKPFWMA